MLSVGDFGLGSTLPRAPYSDTITNMFYTPGDAGVSQPTSDAGWCHLVLAASSHYRAQLSLKYSEGKPRAFILNRYGASSGGWTEIYSAANTTKASDGTLKAASPVARIVKSQEECQRTDIDEPGFVWCGCGTANAEAEGINLSRLDVGVYMLTGSAGLASEGWQLLPPMDPGGMGELGVVEAEQTESGGLTIRLYKQKYMLSDGGEIVKTKGEPMDVPVSSWIDVRLDMPTDSVFKRSQQRLQSDEES